MESFARGQIPLRDRKIVTAQHIFYKPIYHYVTNTRIFTNRPIDSAKAITQFQIMKC